MIVIRDWNANFNNKSSVHRFIIEIDCFYIYVDYAGRIRSTKMLSNHRLRKTLASDSVIFDWSKKLVKYPIRVIE